MTIVSATPTRKGVRLEFHAPVPTRKISGRLATVAEKKAAGYRVI